MFNDVNKVILMGNITNDPDLRYTTGGTPVLNFGIATNRNYKVGDEWRDEVTYHNIVVWRSAESLAKRIKKGTRLYIEGRIHTRSWEGNDGQKKYKTEITADNISLVARYESGSDAELGDATTAAKNSGNSESSGGEEDIDPNDLPF